MKGKGKRPSAFGRKSLKKRDKPPAKDSMGARVPRKLSDIELDERRKRFQLKFGEKRALEKRRAQVTRELNGEIKDLANELDLLHEQLLHGEEQVKQGDLFIDGSTHLPPKDQAARTLAELEKATSPAAQFVASLGERNGMDENAIKRSLWGWCADKGIRGKDAREALWLGVQEIVAKPEHGTPPADGKEE